MNSHRSTTSRYLDACAEIEKCAALMYNHFSRQEKPGSSRQNMWMKLAAEERQHVNQVEYLRKVARRLKLGKHRVDCERILGLARKAEHCLSKVFTMPYDPQVAFTLSVSLESWFFDLHEEQTRKFCKDRLSFLFNALATSDLQHIKTIQAIYNESSAQGETLQAHSFADVLSL